MKSYKESGLYDLGKRMQKIGNVLVNEKSTMTDVVKAFHDSGFGLEFRLVPKNKGEDDDT